MIILDTDHLTVLTDVRNSHHERLKQRVKQANEPVVTTIVNVEELLRGWLAYIHRCKDVHRQVSAYQRLGRLFSTLGA